MSKRPSSPTSGGALMKRARATPPPSTQIAISFGNEDRNKGLIRTVARTSNLDAPIVSLAGAHAGEILSCRFDPTGQMSLHPILDLQWSLYSPLYSVSADHTLTMTDVTTGQKTRKIRAHREIINSLDRTMAREDAGKQAVATFEVGCPVTSVCWSADGNSVYIGAIDNEVHVYDLRKSEQVSSLVGHTDTPTSLALSPNGSFLLSPSFSSQTFVWDNTLLRGAWSKDDGGNRVAVGGADRMVCIWDVDSGKILYKLPGHKGTVTSVDFHPKSPSVNGTMLLGEIEA
ncbi:WD40-repeat-containing domain protein, partial [Pholiota molesta]